MPKTDPRVDAYIARSPAFAQPILRHVRKLVHRGCPAIEETIKWGFPHFMHQGILCSMAAFKHHCALSFWKRKLLFPDAPAAENGGMGQFGRIASIADLPQPAALLRYIRAAARLNETGAKPPASPKPRIKQKLSVPTCLRNALDNNPRARTAFAAFSHSHRKEYVDWITEAKKEETRQKRLATAITWLAEGKPRHWQYVRPAF